MSKAKRHGFSMLELIFAAGLMGMSVGLFVLSGGTRLKAKPGADALAEALANDLGQARLQAMRQLSPVAVMFPCDGGRPHCASLYQLEGLTNPHVARSHNFAGDFPGFSIFVGRWTGNETLAPLVVGTKWADFDVLQWLPDAREKDSALIFMPDGTVRGTRAGANLPQFDGEYHLAVSAGVNYSGDTLTGAGETNTVCINGGGAIRVESGLTGSTIRTIGTTVNSSPPSTPVTQTNLGHALGATKGASSLPSPSNGNPTRIPPDGYATVTAFAHDQNLSGERLFLRWTVVAPPGKGDGVFSIPLDPSKGAAMDFNPKATIIDGGAVVKPAYESSYQWHPPANAEPDEVYSLQLRLQDQATGTWLPVQIQKDVKIEPYGAILFEYSKGSERGLYRMNVNGTGKSRFHVVPSTPAEPLNYHEFSPAVSPDGNRIVFLSNDRDGVPPGCQDIFLTDRNGLTCTQVTRGLWCEAPCLSPDGTRVAFKRYFAATNSYDVCIVPIAPTTTVATAPAGLDHPGPIQNPPVTQFSGTRLDGIKTAAGWNANPYREERLAWVPGSPGNPDKLYYAKTFLNHLATPLPADGPPTTGDHPFLVDLDITRSGQYLGGPNNSFPEDFHYGSWAGFWSPFSGQLYRTVDGAANQGDPLLRIFPPGWTVGNSMGSPGYHDTQPAPYLTSTGAGSEALLLVRSPANDPGNYHRICRLPRGATNDSQIEPITGELNASNATCPIYLR